MVSSPTENYNQDYLDGYNAGLIAGANKVKVAALGFLERKYLSREILRGSTEGKAILQAASDLSKYLTGDKLNSLVEELKLNASQ